MTSTWSATACSIEASVQEYPAHRDCFSCHHQAVPALALTLALAFFSYRFLSPRPLLQAIDHVKGPEVRASVESGNGWVDSVDSLDLLEILVEPAFRGRGIAQAIYAERERHARAWGYRHLCLAVVQRDGAGGYVR